MTFHPRTYSLCLTLSSWWATKLFHLFSTYPTLLKFNSTVLYLKVRSKTFMYTEDMTAGLWGHILGQAVCVLKDEFEKTWATRGVVLVYSKLALHCLLMLPLNDNKSLEMQVNAEFIQTQYKPVQVRTERWDYKPRSRHLTHNTKPVPLRPCANRASHCVESGCVGDVPTCDWGGSRERSFTQTITMTNSGDNMIMGLLLMTLKSILTCVDLILWLSFKFMPEKQKQLIFVQTDFFFWTFNWRIINVCLV